MLKRIFFVFEIRFLKIRCFHEMAIYKKNLEKKEKENERAS